MIKNTPFQIKYFLEYLLKFFDGSITHTNNVYTLTFNSTLGKGKIILNPLNWGVFVLRFDIYVHKDLVLKEFITQQDAVGFLFISNGTLKYSTDNSTTIRLDQYRNIIASIKNGVKRSIHLKANTKLTFNYVHVPCKEFFTSENILGTTLDYVEFDNFLCTASTASCLHIGRYSLKIENQIKKLNKTWNSPAITRLYFEGQVYLLLAYHLNEYRDDIAAKHPFSKTEINKIHQAVDFIESHISTPLSIPLLCKHFGLTPNKIQAGFQSVFSKTVNEYIRHVRLENAQVLIATTDLSISEIVYRVGLNSKSYFSKIFKEQYGILPTEYRVYRRQKFTAERGA